MYCPKFIEKTKSNVKDTLNILRNVISISQGNYDNIVDTFMYDNNAMSNAHKVLPCRKRIRSNPAGMIAYLQTRDIAVKNLFKHDLCMAINDHSKNRMVINERTNIFKPRLHVMVT